MTDPTDNVTQNRLAQLHERGYTLIPDFLSPQRLEQVNALYDTMLGSHSGRNNFEGNCTERIYTLVARDKLFQDIAEDPRIMALCDALFMPNYLLTANQAIVISPGETPQPWHTDDSFYPIPRPRPMISLSTIVAVGDFTVANGGTQIIPGSHLWSDEQIAGDYVSGNRESDPDFGKKLQGMALDMTNCEPWARPQENFFLAIPPAKVAQMSAKMQSLLGYSIHPPFMGQVTASHPRKALAPDFVPPACRE
jgi:ectoine hydroxylase-related dioxygenase (phytanoyl-CoA dioxygenase family)